MPSNENSKSETESSTKPTDSPTAPTVVDRRAGRAERRRQSLYEGRDPGEDYRLEHVSRVRTAPARWAPGQDPHDDDAVKGSGWEYVKLDVTETPDDQRDVDQYRDLSGPPSGVHCFQCPQGEYRMVQERRPDEVAETQPDVQWAQKNNRPVDPLKIPTVWLLFCPGCKHMVQMRESVVRMLRGERIENFA